MKPFDTERPEIAYPCSWTYRVICTDEVLLRVAIRTIVGAAEHTVANIGSSESGRYQRLELLVTVRDEQHRNEIFAALGRESVVRFVL